jgi:hypothetical protein
MNNNQITSIFIIAIIAVTSLFGGMITMSILQKQWLKEAVTASIEKGQNPLFAKCSLEDQSSTDCRMLITAMSLSGQFKDPIAPKAEIASKK